MSQFIGEDSTHEVVQHMDRDSQTTNLMKKLQELENRMQKISPSSKKIVKTQKSASLMTKSSIPKSTTTKTLIQSHSNKNMKKKLAAKIISVSYPVKIDDNSSKIKATYKVDIDFVGHDGKKHFKQVHFGDQ